MTTAKPAIYPAVDLRSAALIRPGPTPVASVLDEGSFHHTIAIERKRTERSKKPFLLVLLDAGSTSPTGADQTVLRKILSALSLSMRATDVIGWYKSDRTVGVMFTEISIDHHGTILSTMMTRIGGTLQKTLTIEKFSQIGISLHVFPEAWNQDRTHGNPILYPDLVNRDDSRKTYQAAKRVMDIAGSLFALIVFSPAFLVVAALVKLSSEGPILFQQKRLGQFGETFTFLKFRSMRVNNDHKLHAEFMKQVIRGSYDGTLDEGNKPVYKMTNDPRVTKIGHFLRRTSLDELPQFINVLRGDMSLVGPRPPIAYECEEYELWHRRRVLEVKPGITGLWQVKGRSRVRFDDMVRLDLQYVRRRSLWLDLQILMQTPRAVLFGEDAF
jgi:lipopolysaccharide/colanic/teichoic acid biosynthesis glycosyltransferase